MNAKTARLIRKTAGTGLYRKAKRVWRETPRPKRAELRQRMKESL